LLGQSQQPYGHQQLAVTLVIHHWEVVHSSGVLLSQYVIIRYTVFSLLIRDYLSFIQNNQK